MIPLYAPVAAWWKLPTLLALFYLAVTRTVLFTNNLFDTYGDHPWPVKDCTGVNTAARTLDGSCNNLEHPAWGAAGTRFGRYVPIDKTYSEDKTLYTPNPRTISQELFKRKSFVPATSVNLLASAWIQFQTHDWFSHGEFNDPHSLMVFDLPENDSLRAEGHTNITVRRTIKEVHPDRPNTYTNINTHWWDLSQIYGSDEATNKKLRSYEDGKMKVDTDNLLPVGDDGLDITGLNDNWWAGLSVMHNIWTREHNLVCDMFKKNHPDWTDTEIYDHARLVTTALNAKIHTVEWTPALLQTEVLDIAMRSNWDGLKALWAKYGPGGQKRSSIDNMKPARELPELVSRELIRAWHGIIGGDTHFAGVPFSHSEEFVSIYRFHSLLQDTLEIRDRHTGESTGKKYSIPEYAFRGAQDVIRGNDFSDVVFTFGVDHPGAMVLNNYPAGMLHLTKPGQPYNPIDMGVVDILRDRERGVPRYNQFCRLFSLIPPKTMDDLSDDKDVVAALRKVYGDDVESVDLLVGSLAESPRPTGFAFSNAQFQAFIFAASRRLLTDRFFTTDYTAEVYTQDGLDWIANSDFSAVVARTVPELESAVPSGDNRNAFTPWPQAQAPPSSSSSLGSSFDSFSPMQEPLGDFADISAMLSHLDL
ncbi:heme peroxidase [Mycena latifolia]|nr:heme peroxidase [Mycena latifolia]